MLRRIGVSGVGEAGWRVMSDKRGKGSRGHVLKGLEFHARQCVLYLAYNEGFYARETHNQICILERSLTCLPTLGRILLVFIIQMPT